MFVHALYKYYLYEKVNGLASAKHESGNDQIKFTHRRLGSVSWVRALL